MIAETARERSLRWLLTSFAAAAPLLLAPAEADAQSTEVTFAIGSLLGDDVAIDFDLIGEARSSFDNSPMYGGRLGWYGWPLGVEASVTYSPSGLADPPPGFGVGDVSILYGEGNALLIIIPGPIGPFVTGGVGIHRFRFYADDVEIAETALGWNWGGGLKINLGPVVVRGDVRDHVTKFDSGDIAALLGVDNTFHNWEASAGIGVRF